MRKGKKKIALLKITTGPAREIHGNQDRSLAQALESHPPPFIEQALPRPSLAIRSVSTVRLARVEVRVRADTDEEAVRMADAALDRGMAGRLTTKDGAAVAYLRGAWETPEQFSSTDIAVVTNQYTEEQRAYGGGKKRRRRSSPTANTAE